MSTKLNICKMIYESNDISIKDKINMINDVKYMSEDELIEWIDESVGRVAYKYGRKVLSKNAMRDVSSAVSSKVKSSSEKIAAAAKRNANRNVWARFRKNKNLGKEITAAANKSSHEASYAQNAYAQ